MDIGKLPSIEGGNARKWDEEGYRRSILLERELSSRIVFRTAFVPDENPNPEILLVASSDGLVSAYSISSCISPRPRPMLCSKEVIRKSAPESLSIVPLCSIQAHKGPAYDLKFYGDDEDPLLLSCGDDGCIRGWKWAEVLIAADQGSSERLNPILELVNPQKEGPWGALSPIPENNAIAVDKEEMGKTKNVFKGHTDYLHSVVRRKSSNQIITGSEDGTVRVWDCRSGKCAQVIYPHSSSKLKESSWISSVALDSSENWLVCGTGRGLSAWSLLSYECIFDNDSCTPIQDLLFHDNQVCAVGGYGGLVDVISEFGSHLCILCCNGAGPI